MTEAELAAAERDVGGAGEILCDDDVGTRRFERAVDLEQTSEVSGLDAELAPREHVHGDVPVLVQIGPVRFDLVRRSTEIEDVDLIAETCERDGEVREHRPEPTALDAAQLVGHERDAPPRHARERCTSRPAFVPEALIASAPR